ncbi:hypothetical protein DFH05DRAFT_1499807 [Lentinula detonsa]|uniref:Uncharacterized protein n=1 Tax=Lentinula detonsa TaxID=2804962 RepID=A0A9W8TWG0_9AGAR|nr:hypothetical protein DFH05DRAFT_1517446 [Lentinula detonsa]KAJ3743217.1 hypothetical protein DFH05DRAFT_1499807 [Lentinula detonsa]
MKIVLLPIDKRTMFPRPTRQSAHVKQRNRAKERLEFHLQVEKTRTHRHPHPLLFQTWPACPKQQCLLARVVQKRMSDMVQGINDDAEDFRANAEYRMQEGFNELNALIAEHVPSLELDAQGNLVPKATDRIDNPASMMDPIDVESPTDNTKNREYIYVPPAKRVPKSEDTQSRPMSTLQYRRFVGRKLSAPCSINSRASVAVGSGRHVLCQAREGVTRSDILIGKRITHRAFGSIQPPVIPPMDLLNRLLDRRIDRHFLLGRWPCCWYRGWISLYLISSNNTTWLLKLTSYSLQKLL